MSKAEILAELPRLSTEDRAEILDCLWRLEESGGPSEFEKTVLNEAQASYDANPTEGAPCREAEEKLRRIE